MTLKTNHLILGDCIAEMKKIPDNCIDMIFADPPYNLQLGEGLTRPNNSVVKGVNNAWDKFDTFKSYDDFSETWMYQARRILKPTGSFWVIGSYHNIFRVGTKVQDLGFWILNDVVWVKNNPMPNFRGTRLTNAHETVIWAAKDKDAKYTFNYHALKALNEDLQMRSDWHMPICSGAERLKDNNGDKVHPTQKPESLLYRAILASTNPGEVVLDPFSGSGTTAAVAKKMGRKYIGVEQDATYMAYAQQRLEKIMGVQDATQWEVTAEKRKQPRIPFGNLLEAGLLHAGATLTSPCNRHTATVRADGSIISNNFSGSIHKVGAAVQGTTSCNGWTYWRLSNKSPIDTLRNQMRNA